MATVLEVSPSEVKEAVRRDRCDWLAAVYNLLMDQPEGRNILQGMMNEDPDDQLTDAAHFPGSIEHLRLSQGGMFGVCVYSHMPQLPHMVHVHHH